MITSIKRFIKHNIAKHYWNWRGRFTYFNQTIFFPKHSAIYQRTIEEGIFEIDHMQIMCALAKPDTEVFDIGANIGIMLAPILHNNGSITVVAVEASPNNIPYLKKTLEHSAYKDRWSIVDKAVFNYVGKISFQTATQANGAYDSILNTNRVPFQQTIEIECTTLDKIWEDRGRPMVSFIKIDIEGADLIALQAGINCINTCKPAILMEWNQLNIAPFKLVNNDLYDFVGSINYLLYALPNMNRVVDLVDLELHSNFTENFLLIPKGN